MHAYNEEYLHDTMKNMGGMLDFAVNDCLYTLSTFLQMFLISGVAEQIACGNPCFVAGMSGEELALCVFRKSGLVRDFPDAVFRPERTREYWSGWILAYTQWRNCLSFEQIFRGCTAGELLDLYPILHEASEQKAADVLLARIEQKRKQTQLQRLRMYAGLTQAALAERSGVSLRSIQMYEQQRKDIRKAQAATIRRLAGIFGCRERDLLQ